MIEINHALIAVVMGDGELDILHFCGFDHKPTKEDYEMFRQKFAGEYEIQEASSELVKYYKNLNPPDEDAYYVEDDELRCM